MKNVCGSVSRRVLPSFSRNSCLSPISLNDDQNSKIVQLSVEINLNTEHRTKLIIMSEAQSANTNPPVEEQPTQHKLWLGLISLGKTILSGMEYVGKQIN